MNPDILDYFVREHGLHAKFFHYEKNGEVKASYFITENRTLGLSVWRDFPVSFDEVLIPMDKDIKLFLPDSINKISAGNKSNVLNSTFTLFRKKKLCWVKDVFSSKNEKARRNEFNKFIKNGGTVKSCEKIAPQELAEIYVHLFKLRFAETVHCYKLENLVKIFSEFRHMLFGHVLFMDEAPCAFDLILKSECNDLIYFDVPNGGLDKNYLHLSIGSVLMWLNIKSANALCASLNKKKVMSIGMLEPQWEYKKRWATASNLGKVVF